MGVFEINIPARTIVGLNVVNRLPEIIKDYGERVMIVTSPEIKDLGLLKKIQSLAEAGTYGVIVFDGVSSDSGSDVVDEGVMLARESKTNVVIGLGGSNTLNVAKAIAYIAGNQGFTADYFAGRMGRNNKIPYIEIPTTHGISYGLLDSFFIKDSEDNIKKEYRSRFNFADVVLADAKFTTSLPNKFVVAIGIEMMALAFDAYVSKASTILTESYTSHAMELVYKHLKTAIIDSNNMTARQALTTAGIFTSMAINSSRPGTTFALAQPLSTRLGLYHGIGASILLPHVMEFNLTASPNKYVKIARALGEDVNDISVVEAAIKAVEAVRKILFELNVPQRMKSFDVDEERLDEVVRDARTFDFLNVLPRPVTYDDLLNILTAAC